MTRDHLLSVGEVFPMPPILGYLGEVPDERGRYWCPWHDDRATGKPSADVWGEDDEMLGCWSCGTRGDALDVIVQVERVRREDALAIARQAVKTYVPPQRLRRPPPSPERLEAELKRTTTGIRYPRDIDPLHRWQFDRDLPSEEYMRSWGWVGDYRGRVVMPHRSHTGALTGLRFRRPPKWEKDGRRGSRFKQVYGGWRLPAVSRSRNGAPVEELWLCEGETDTVWTGWHVEVQDTTAAAVGLPTASLLPTEEDVALFEGRRAVLVLDPGQAGQRATDLWADALEPVVSDLVVFRLEGTRDMCERNPLDFWRKLHG